MESLWISLLYYLILFDAVFANVIAFSAGQVLWERAAAPLARYFPLRRGWTAYYLLLLLIIGYLLVQLDWLYLPF